MSHNSEHDQRIGAMSCDELRHLRCALGQSRADFARTFGVKWELVMQWESGECSPSNDQNATLIRLSQQAEAFAEKTMLRPALEAALKDRNLGQIHESEVRLAAADREADLAVGRNQA